jgi:hypothetical protein
MISDSPAGARRHPRSYDAFPDECEQPAREWRVRSLDATKLQDSSSTVYVSPPGRGHVGIPEHRLEKESARVHPAGRFDH